MHAMNAIFDLLAASISLYTSERTPASVHMPVTNAVIDARVATHSLHTSVLAILASVSSISPNTTFETTEISLYASVHS